MKRNIDAFLKAYHVVTSDLKKCAVLIKFVFSCTKHVIHGSGNIPRLRKSNKSASNWWERLFSLQLKDFSYANS